MRHRQRGFPWPIYTFGLVWAGIALFMPLLRLTAWLLTFGLSLATAVAVAQTMKKKATGAAAAEDTAETEESAAQSSYSPEVEAILADWKLARSEMYRLYNSIQDQAVRGKINEIIIVSEKIVKDAIDDPSDVPQIRKFLDFYLPTTLKLLNAYDRMDAQAIDGENISGSKQRIDEMLDTTIEAYKKHLDSLFANQALDIDAEIRAMNGMLAREGLSGKSYLDINDYLKKYKDAEKGSTQNG